MSIEYKINEPISTDQFIALLKASTLGARRPVEDRECMQGMISNSNLTVSAWNDGHLVGIARSVTDFHYACYLSDLAVILEYQKSGIGKRLQTLTQEQLGPKCYRQSDPQRHPAPAGCGGGLFSRTGRRR